MKKILLTIVIIIIILSVNALAIDIDIGNPAITGGGYLNPDFTFIDLNNPANTSGKIVSVELYAQETLSNCEVAIFYLVSGTSYSTRDTHTIGTVTAGAKRTFTVDLDVQAGDYIGLYFSAGVFEAGEELGSTKFRSVSGDRIPCTNISFATIGERLISLFGTGTASDFDIDIGMPAIDRGSAFGSFTIINIGNPANAAGTITSVEIWAADTLVNCEVATFYGSGTTYSTRDSEYIGTVVGGSKQTFTVDLDVEVGDYLGIYYTDGSIERDTSGYDGCWYVSSDQIPCTDFTFGTAAGDAISLYGTGGVAGWAHKWNTQTISKWNGQEFTKWNDLE